MSDPGVQIVAVVLVVALLLVAWGEFKVRLNRWRRANSRRRDNSLQDPTGSELE